MTTDSELPEAEHGDTERALPDWPALMRPETLKAYLDCRSNSAFARKLRVLKERGYPGMDPLLHAHVKAVVDQYLTLQNVAAEARKARMMKAARGEAA